MKKIFLILICLICLTSCNKESNNNKNDLQKNDNNLQDNIKNKDEIQNEIYTEDNNQENDNIQIENQKINNTNSTLHDNKSEQEIITTTRPKITTTKKQHRLQLPHDLTLLQRLQLQLLRS